MRPWDYRHMPPFLALQKLWRSKLRSYAPMANTFSHQTISSTPVLWFTVRLSWVLLLHITSIFYACGLLVQLVSDMLIMLWTNPKSPWGTLSHMTGTAMFHAPCFKDLDVALPLILQIVEHGDLKANLESPSPSSTLAVWFMCCLEDNLKLTGYILAAGPSSFLSKNRDHGTKYQRWDRINRC